MMKKTTFCTLLLIISISSISFAQLKRDTSYTVYSAFQKISKTYPDISYPNTNELKSKLKYLKEIPYSIINDNRKLNLDIIKKENAQSNPVVILVHGGGWGTGSKELLLQLAEKIADAGYTSVLVEYRLSPEAKYPAAIEDIQNAFLWLLENAEAYQISKNNYAFLGTSAGAQIAGYAALKQANQYDEVKAYVNIDGIVSFVTPLALEWENRKGDNSAAGKWFGGSFEKVPEIWKEASLIQYVNQKSPKTLFVNSSFERFHAGRELFIEKLDEFNINSKIVNIENSPHSFWLLEPWCTPTSEAIVNFLDEQLKGK